MSVETVHLSVPLISPAPSSVVSVTLAPGFRGAALLLDWPLCRDAADADAADAAVKSHPRRQLFYRGRDTETRLMSERIEQEELYSLRTFFI